MDGPWLPDPVTESKKRKAYLFCFLDDYARLVPYAEFFWDEALPRMERVLKVAMLRRGVPKAIYVDNGKVYAANQFAAAYASLGIQRIHSQPYCPEGRGKQERFFETVRLQFMPEVAVSSIATLDELNQSFWTWLELIYHQAIHSETSQTPLARYQQGLKDIRSADHNQLVQAFRWRETRKVRKDGRIELQGNSYQVDPAFIGRSLELRFDPFDLSSLELWFNGRCLGNAKVSVQNRQRHIQVEKWSLRHAQPPPSTLRPITWPCCARNSTNSSAKPPVRSSSPSCVLYSHSTNPHRKNDMLQPFFGFTRLPFTKDIPPEKLFPADGQNELCARLDYLLQDRDLGLVTGETGSGKSTSLRRFTASLDPNRYQVIYLANTFLGLTGIYRDLLTALGHQPVFGKPKAVARIRA
jgi:hypothetical protein